MRADNKHCHRVNGEVQTQVYANIAFLIVSVRVHYADERGIKIKKTRLRFAVVMPLERLNTGATAGSDDFILFCSSFRWQKQKEVLRRNTSIFTELNTYCQY